MKFPDRRITTADIESLIIDERYINAGDAFQNHTSEFAKTQLGLLTICVLVLENGFTVTGESACAFPANFNNEIGRKIAREKAIEKIWPLLGFMLRDQLHQVEKADLPSLSGMHTYHGEKIVHAMPMTRAGYNQFRGWELPADENGDDLGYLVEYADGGQANVEGFAGYVSWSPADVFERAYKGRTAQ